MTLRAIKGATTISVDSAREICVGTGELLQAMLDANNIDLSHVVSLVLTATPDLRSEFPARGARDVGWGDVPMICAQELDVPGALPRCIRALLHVQHSASAPIRHIYLRDAAGLRPDIATSP